MTLTEKERIDMLEASEVRWQRLVDEQLSILTKEIITNIRLMREHFESHYLDKKERYTPKRKTFKYY